MLPTHDGRVLIFGGFDGTAFLGDLTAAVLDHKDHHHHGHAK